MMQEVLNKPIFITGVERSGSSIVARIINSCGAWSGGVTEMMENRGIKRIVDNYYYEHKYDVRGQFPLPNTKELTYPSKWQQNVEHSICSERWIGEDYWMYKSARVCQIWPIWNHFYPNAKYIIVRRKTGDIVQSCMKTAYMNAYRDSFVKKMLSISTPQEGWLWWIHQHEKLFVEMIEAGLNCKVIWPERMAVGDFEQIKEMIEWLGLTWNDNIPEMVKPMFNNSLQRERS